MGLTFHDKTSLAEAACNSRYMADEPNLISPGTRSITQDGALCIGADVPNEMVSIRQERRDNDDHDDIQMVDDTR